MTRWAPALAAGLLLATAACGGDDTTRVTLTDDDCAYDGPESVDAGTVAIDLENESDATGIFELLQIAPGRSFEGLRAHVAAEQQRIDAGQDVLGPPAFATVVLQVEVEPGEVGTLTSGLAEATYGVTCASGQPPSAVYVAGPFEAT